MIESEPLRVRIVEAASLADHLAQGPLSLRTALAYAADLATVLGEIHRNGLAHGDVSPDSIHIDRFGARLLPPNGHAAHATPADDASGFGQVLQQMLSCVEPHAPASPDGRAAADDLRGAFHQLASECLAARPDAPDLRKIATRIRVLRVLAGLHAEGAHDHPRQPVCEPQVQTPEAEMAAVAAGSATPVSAGWSAPAAEAPRRAGGREFRSPGECPVCDGPAHPSAPAGVFERSLQMLGIQFHRCHWCYYRYMLVFGRKLARED